MSDFTESFDGHITIKSDGVFIGGKLTSQYLGNEIRFLPDVVSGFANIQKASPNISEIHVMSSITERGDYVYGNPSNQHGEHSWCRLVFNNGRVSSWFYVSMYCSKEICAAECVSDCVNRIRYNTGFRAKMCDDKLALRALVEVIKEKDIDLPKLAGQLVDLYGVKIIFEKSTQKTK